MFAFSLYSMLFSLLPGIIHTVQTVKGDVTAGTTKKQMARDAVAGAASSAAAIFTGGNAELANEAAQAALAAIDTSDAISKIYDGIKGSDAMKAATVTGNAAVKQAEAAKPAELDTAAPTATDALHQAIFGLPQSGDTAAPTAVEE